MGACGRGALCIVRRAQGPLPLAFPIAVCVHSPTTCACTLAVLARRRRDGHAVCHRRCQGAARLGPRRHPCAAAAAGRRTAGAGPRDGGRPAAPPACVAVCLHIWCPPHGQPRELWSGHVGCGVAGIWVAGWQVEGAVRSRAARWPGESCGDGQAPGTRPGFALPPAPTAPPSCPALPSLTCCSPYCCPCCSPGQCRRLLAISMPMSPTVGL